MVFLWNARFSRRRSSLSTSTTILSSQPSRVRSTNFAHVASAVLCPALNRQVDHWHSSTLCQSLWLMEKSGWRRFQKFALSFHQLPSSDHLLLHHRYDFKVLSHCLVLDAHHAAPRFPLDHSLRSDAQHARFGVTFLFAHDFDLVLDITVFFQGFLLIFINSTRPSTPSSTHTILFQTSTI